MTPIVAIMSARGTDARGFVLWHVVGVCCADPEPYGKRLLLDDIGDYRQTCHHCGRTIVEPRSTYWPELYPDRRR